MLPVVFCVFPLSGALCTLVCNPTVTAATDQSAPHHGAAHRQHARPAAESVQVDPLASRACVAQVNDTQPATVLAVRDHVTTPGPAATSASAGLVGRPHVRRVATPHSHPLGTAPPITTPLVLRV
jgi:hypothetical protein